MKRLLLAFICLSSLTSLCTEKTEAIKKEELQTTLKNYNIFTTRALLSSPFTTGLLLSFLRYQSDFYSGQNWNIFIAALAAPALAASVWTYFSPLDSKNKAKRYQRTDILTLLTCAVAYGLLPQKGNLVKFFAGDRFTASLLVGATIGLGFHCWEKLSEIIQRKKAQLQYC